MDEVLKLQRFMLHLGRRDALARGLDGVIVFIRFSFLLFTTSTSPVMLLVL